MRFVDTSFWVALALTRDAHHDAARALWADRGAALLTTNHVLGETWTFLRRRAGHATSLRQNKALRHAPTLVVHHVEPELEEQAWGWLERHDEREYSYVDATSFAVMRRLRILEALAFDGDFSAAGFVELPPST